jgi:hypothetical protein
MAKLMECFMLRQRNPQATLLSCAPVKRTSARMLFFNMSGVQYTKKVSGQAVQTLRKHFHITMTTRDIDVGTILDDYSCGVEGMQGTH